MASSDEDDLEALRNAALATLKNKPQEPQGIQVLSSQVLQTVQKVYQVPQQKEEDYVEHDFGDVPFEFQQAVFQKQSRGMGFFHGQRGFQRGGRRGVRGGRGGNRFQPKLPQSALIVIQVEDSEAEKSSKSEDKHKESRPFLLRPQDKWASTDGSSQCSTPPKIKDTSKFRRYDDDTDSDEDDDQGGDIKRMRTDSGEDHVLHDVPLEVVNDEIEILVHKQNSNEIESTDINEDIHIEEEIINTNSELEKSNNVVEFKSDISAIKQNADFGFSANNKVNEIISDVNINDNLEKKEEESFVKTVNDKQIDNIEIKQVLKTSVDVIVVPLNDNVKNEEEESFNNDAVVSDNTPLRDENQTPLRDEIQHEDSVSNSYSTFSRFNRRHRRSSDSAEESDSDLDDSDSYKSIQINRLGPVSMTSDDSFSNLGSDHEELNADDLEEVTERKTNLESDKDSKVSTAAQIQSINVQPNSQDKNSHQSAPKPISSTSSSTSSSSSDQSSASDSDCESSSSASSSSSSESSSNKVLTAKCLKDDNSSKNTNVAVRKDHPVKKTISDAIGHKIISEKNLTMSNTLSSTFGNNMRNKGIDQDLDRRKSNNSKSGKEYVKKDVESCKEKQSKSDLRSRLHTKHDNLPMQYRGNRNRLKSPDDVKADPEFDASNYRDDSMYQKKRSVSQLSKVVKDSNKIDVKDVGKRDMKSARSDKLQERKSKNDGVRYFKEIEDLKKKTEIFKPDEVRYFKEISDLKSENEIKTVKKEGPKSRSFESLRKTGSKEQRKNKRGGSDKSQSKPFDKVSENYFKTTSKSPHEEFSVRDSLTNTSMSESKINKHDNKIKDSKPSRSQNDKQLESTHKQLKERKHPVAGSHRNSKVVTSKHINPEKSVKDSKKESIQERMKMIANQELAKDIESDSEESASSLSDISSESETEQWRDKKSGASRRTDDIERERRRRYFKDQENIHETKQDKGRDRYGKIGEDRNTESRNTSRIESNRQHSDRYSSRPDEFGRNKNRDENVKQKYYHKKNMVFIEEEPVFTSKKFQELSSGSDSDNLPHRGIASVVKSNKMREMSSIPSLLDVKVIPPTKLKKDDKFVKKTVKERLVIQVQKSSDDDASPSDKKTKQKKRKKSKSSWSEEESTHQVVNVIFDEATKSDKTRPSVYDRLGTTVNKMPLQEVRTESVAVGFKKSHEIVVPAGGKRIKLRDSSKHAVTGKKESKTKEQMTGGGDDALDKHIQTIKEKNAEILRRKMEVEQDKKKYG